MGKPKFPNVPKTIPPEIAETLASLQKTKTSRTTSNIGMFSQGIITLQGVTRVVQMFEPNGKPMCPQVLNSYNPSHDVFPIRDIYKNPRVGINVRTREVAANPDVYLPFWVRGYTVDPELIYEHLGVNEILELPRGAVDKPEDLYTATEAAEELGLQVDFAITMGFINDNPGNHLAAPIALLALLSERPSLLDAHERASVADTLWLTPEELQKVDTICGITLALITKTRWFLNQKLTVRHCKGNYRTYDALRDFGRRM